VKVSRLVPMWEAAPLNLLVPRRTPALIREQGISSIIHRILVAAFSTFRSELRGTNNSIYTVVADRVTIAFLGSPFPYIQISPVRSSRS